MSVDSCLQSDVTPDSRLQDEFELWNEPTLAPASYEPYAKLAAVTCVAIHTSRRAVGASPPAMFYGALSGGYASGAGVAFVNGSLPLLARMLASGGSGLTLADCVSAVTYHACECLGSAKKKKKKRRRMSESLAMFSSTLKWALPAAIRPRRRIHRLAHSRMLPLRPPPAPSQTPQDRPKTRTRGR